jgi:hypothetical protein
MTNATNTSEWLLKLDAAQEKPKSSVKITSEDALGYQIDEMLRRSNGSAILLLKELWLSDICDQ